MKLDKYLNENTKETKIMKSIIKEIEKILLKEYKNVKKSAVYDEITGEFWDHLEDLITEINWMNKINIRNK